MLRTEAEDRLRTKVTYRLRGGGPKARSSEAIGQRSRAAELAASRSLSPITVAPELTGCGGHVLGCPPGARKALASGGGQGQDQPRHPLVGVEPVLQLTKVVQVRHGQSQAQPAAARPRPGSPRAGRPGRTAAAATGCSCTWARASECPAPPPSNSNSGPITPMPSARACPPACTSTWLMSIDGSRSGLRGTRPTPRRRARVASRTAHPTALPPKLCSVVRRIASKRRCAGSSASAEGSHHLVSI